MKNLRTSYGMTLPEIVFFLFAFLASVSAFAARTTGDIWLEEIAKNHCWPVSMNALLPGDTDFNVPEALETLVCSVTIDRVDVSGCYQKAGASKATVSVQVSWIDAPTNGDITVMLGTETRTIFTGPRNLNYDGITSQIDIVSPQVVAFEVDADGSLANSVTASFDVTCTAIAETFDAPMACSPTACSGQNLGGTVFNDYDADGIKDIGETQGTGNVTLTAFLAGGATQTTTTDEFGSYSFNLAAGDYPVRLEVDGIPNNLGQGTPNGSSNGTTVQFVASASCTADVGVLNPSDFCQANPLTVIPCYIAGALSNAQVAASDALIAFDYTLTGLKNESAMTTLATTGEIGSTWGVARNRTLDEFFVSAVLKRHAGLTSNGLSAIFKTEIASPLSASQTSLWLDVNTNLGVDVGTVGTNASRGIIGGLASPSVDNIGFVNAGKLGIGDIDLSEDDNTLYFTNLNDQKLYVVDITAYTSDGVTLPTAADVQSYDLPINCGMAGSLRPWAVKAFEGKVFVGAVCDASVSGNKSDLTGYVVEFDPANGFSASVALEFPLTYPKGFSLRAYPSITGWFPWSDTWSDKVAGQLFSGSPQFDVLRPEPILADIEFDIDGSIIIVLNDRTGLQSGVENYSPNGAGALHNGFVAGDVLRGYFSNGTYIIENNGSAGPAAGFGVGNVQGPGFGEFYDDNSLSIFASTLIQHAENVMGGAALRPGSGEVNVAALDPINLTGDALQQFFAGGLRRWNNETGVTNSAYQVYRTFGGDVGTFSKATGLGDIELGCSLPLYLEIGNRVWIDTDGDGVQDPDEAGLDGVDVALYRTDNGNFVATTTTANGGQYYFGDGDVEFGVEYAISFGTDDQNMSFANGILTVGMQDYFLTTAENGEGSNVDLNDSDATIATAATVAWAGLPTIIHTARGDAGVDHRLDVGFSLQPAAPPCNEKRLDWDSEEWLAGETNVTFPIGLTTVEVDIEDIPFNTYEVQTTGNTQQDIVTVDRALPDDNSSFDMGGGMLGGGQVLELNPAANNADLDVTLTFDDPVENLMFAIFDFDAQEMVTVTGQNGVTAVAPTLSKANSASDIVINNSSASGNGENSQNDDLGTLEIVFDDPVTSVTIAFTQLARVALSDLKICSEGMSIGNLVWDDINNNGLFDDGDENGIEGVDLALYKDENNDGRPDDGIVQTTTTDADGLYLFDELSQGKYLVWVDSLNFQAGGELESFSTSFNTEFDADNDEDGIDNGLNDARRTHLSNGAFSSTVMLVANNEPVVADGEDQSVPAAGTATTDENSNLTVDFGFLIDDDFDGADSRLEGMGDRDMDGRPDAFDFDPAGYIYCQLTGEVVSGGEVSITPPPGGEVFLEFDGSTGFYQFFTDGTAGVYTLIYTPPPGYGLATTTRPVEVGSGTGGAVNPNTNEVPNDNPGGEDPLILGEGATDGSSRALDDFTTASNPYYFTFDLDDQSPFIFNNNIPLTCACDVNVANLEAVECSSDSTFVVVGDISWVIEDPAAEEIELELLGQTFPVSLNGEQVGASEIDILITATPGTNIPVTATFTNSDECEDVALVDLIACTVACTEAPTTVGGTVFNDANANGIEDDNAGGAPNIIVEIFDCEGAVICRTFSNADGDWSCPDLVEGEEYRVEFSNATDPNWVPSPAAASNTTNTQFAIAGTCEVDHAVVDARAYCEANAQTFAPCYVFADFTNGGFEFSDQPAALSTELGPQGNSPATNFVVAEEDIGSVYGVAFQNASAQLFTSSYLKRNARLGPDGGGATTTGGIYLISGNDDGSGEGELFIDLATIINTGANPHPASGDQCASASIGATPSESNCWFHDADAYDKVGRISLGDLEFSPDDTKLFTVNLNNKSLVEIPVGIPAVAPDPSQVVEYDLSAYFSDCTGDDWQPFALGRKGAKMFLGVTCTAESTQDLKDLDAIIYEFSPSNPSQLKLVARFDLDYPRDGIIRNCGNFDPGYEYADPCTSEWRFWSDEFIFDDPNTMVNEAENSPVKYYLRTGSTDRKVEVIGPQPMFTDIEFVGEDMVIGFRDRTPDQYGNDSGSPLDPANDPFLYSAVSAGDLLRTVYNGTTGSQQYDLEFDGEVGTFTTATTPENQGPGGNEFFEDDIESNRSNVFHNETFFGSLAILPGSEEIVATSMNPTTTTSSGGLSYYSTTDGSHTGGTRFYQRDSEPYAFSKAAGLGDLELVCDPLPVQVGNYVWIDDDMDGIQDPCESPIPGIVVSLYSADGTLLSSTATGPDGTYYFDETDGLTPGDDFVIVFGTDGAGTDDFDVEEGLLIDGDDNSYELTVDSTGEGSRPRQNDSDPEIIMEEGQPWDGFPTVFFTAPSSGADHNLDAGFFPAEMFDLALVKRLAATGPFRPGEEVSFEIEVYNQGDIDAVGVEVKDYLPEGLALAATSEDTWTVSVDTAILTEPIDLVAGDSTTLSITLVIASDFMLDTLTNRAEISAFDDDGIPATPPPLDEDSTPNDNGEDEPEADTPDEYADDNPNAPGTEDDPTDEDDYDWEGIPVLQNFDLALIKRLDTDATPGPFTFGGTVTFTLEVKNQGSLDATEVSVADYIPEGLTLVPSATWMQDLDTARLVMPFDLAAGATEELSISFTIDNNFAGTTIDNVAEISNAANALGLEDEDSTPGDNGNDAPEVNSDDEEDDDGPNGNGNPDDPADADDFDLASFDIQGLSLGSTVFLDNNNDGNQNGVDAGIPGLEVQLFDAMTNMQVLTDADGVRVAEAASAAPVTTDGDGNYLFSNLAPGDYFVVLPTAPGFAPISSNNAGIAFVEIDPDNGNVDGDDNGLQPGGSGSQVNSGVITLMASDEPTAVNGETAQGSNQDEMGGLIDENGNMTLDFGFFAPVSIGDTAFVDTDGDGLQSAGDVGLEGVLVAVVDPTTGDTITVDAEGSPITGLTTTDAMGFYEFPNLPPGDYKVIFDISTVDNSVFYAFAESNAGDDVLDSDGVPMNDSVAMSAPTGFLNSGEMDPSLDVGVVCNITVTLAEPFSICSNQLVDLSEDVVIVPDTSSSFGATWTIDSDTPGDFLDEGGNVLAAPYRFGTAVAYRPSLGDARRGAVTFTLTTDTPPDGVPCPAVDASVTIEILKVDCGTFPWTGE